MGMTKRKGFLKKEKSAQKSPNIFPPLCVYICRRYYPTIKVERSAANNACQNLPHPLLDPSDPFTSFHFHSTSKSFKLFLSEGIGSWRGWNWYLWWRINAVTGIHYRKKKSLQLYFFEAKHFYENTFLKEYSRYNIVIFWPNCPWLKCRLKHMSPLGRGHMYSYLQYVCTKVK